MYCKYVDFDNPIQFSVASSPGTTSSSFINGRMTAMATLPNSSSDGVLVLE